MTGQIYISPSLYPLSTNGFHRFSTIGVKAVLGGLRNDATEIGTLFAEMERALIAYSGVDSTLVAKIAYDVLGDRAIAVTAVSPSLLPEELEDAIR